MRKLIANSVLLLLLAVFFAPAFANATSAPVPACCRRGGAHHCTASTQTAESGGASFRAASLCPMWHVPLLVSAIAALPVSHAFAIAVQHEAVAAHALNARSLSVVSSDYQRGPPEFLL